MALSAESSESLWQLNYDARGDVLYACLGDPQPTLIYYEIETDVLLNYAPPKLHVVGITVITFLKHHPRRDVTSVLSYATTVVEELRCKYPLVPVR
jgi:hypothetical protein